MDVKALQARLAAFAAERGWDEVQNPRNLAIAIAGEAGMLLDLFRWLTDAQSHRIQSEYKRDAAEEAIADLVLHTLRLADKLGVDVERAVARKLAENDANYPLPAEEAVASPPAAPVPVTDARPAPPQPVARKPAEAKPAEANPSVEGPAGTRSTEEKPAEARPAAAEPTEPKPPGAAEAKPAAGTAGARVVEPQVEPRAAAMASDAAETRATPAEKSIPLWLDGILPSRGAPGRKKQAAAPKVVSEPAEPPKSSERAAPARKQEPAAPPPRPSTAPVAVLPAPLEEIEAAPPPAEEPVPAPARSEPPRPERYANLDTDAAKALAKSLAKRVDGARSDDPLLRELHDEVETLRRTLYSPTPKTSWMGDSLKTIRALLDEAASHDVGEALRARDYIAQIDRMLAP